MVSDERQICLRFFDLHGDAHHHAFVVGDELRVGSGQLVGPLCTCTFLIPSSCARARNRYASGSDSFQPRESPCHSAV